jgi:hypothetical protein
MWRCSYEKKMSKKAKQDNEKPTTLPTSRQTTSTSAYLLSIKSTNSAFLGLLTKDDEGTAILVEGDWKRCVS